MEILLIIHSVISWSAEKPSCIAVCISCGIMKYGALISAERYGLSSAGRTCLLANVIARKSETIGTFRVRWFQRKYVMCCYVALTTVKHVPQTTVMQSTFRIA